MAEPAHSPSASEALKKLEEQLTCSACQERFQEPRTLPCLHSFCFRCLQQLPLTAQGANHLISCPSCHQTTPLSDKGKADKFPAAFIVNSFLDIHELLQKVSGSKKTDCDNCDKGGAASYCKQCGHFLCQPCVDLHKRWRDFSKHELTGVEEVATRAAQLIPIKEPPTMKCDAHAEPLKIFCETCHQLICHDCTIKLHRDHSYDLVTAVFPKHKQQIERELQQVKEQLSISDAALQSLKDRAGQIFAQGNEVEQQIHTATQQVVKALQESEMQLREKVKTGVQHKLQVLSQQIETVETNLDQLKNCQEFVEQGIRVGTQQRILTVEHQMVEHMRAVSSLVTSSEQQPLKESNVMFTVNKEVLSQCSKLGEVNSSLTVASQIVAEGKGIEWTTAGEETSFELIPSSQAISLAPLLLDLLSCQLITPNSSQPTECTITPTQQGIYTVHYTPTVRGLHQLSVTVGGSNISNSPSKVCVLPSLEMRDHPLHTITGLYGPWGVAACENGEVVVTDCARHNISVLRIDGKKVREIGSKGSGKGQFLTPRGIALTHDGRLFVADQDNHRLQVLTLEGDFVASVGEKGDQALQFNSPFDVAVLPSCELVFIVDRENNRIQVLKDDLTYSHTIGSSGSEKGQLKHPYGIACNSHREVYVADRGNCRVQKFTPEGQFISSFDTVKTRRGTDCCEPVAICFDSTDTVYTCEHDNGCEPHVYHVSVYDSKGRFLKSFGREDLHRPHGVSADSTGNLFVIDHRQCVFVY